ncbi:nucleic acid-binding, OB-fold protein [Artemisia annua]|uniref:Nucleic acid-binding, OB-fold protein n=1 Tax=Artemisia annua TaxID=35608 RepID=A0A2U1N469_ARTAN|nr:nucleic acid-binding, OB-fold protein [Artemisia annua]
MKTKGKAKIRTNTFQNVCPNVSDIVTQPNVVASVDAPSHCTGVLDGFEEQRGFCTLPSFKRKLGDTSLQVESTYSKRLAYEVGDLALTNDVCIGAATPVERNAEARATLAIPFSGVHDRPSTIAGFSLPVSFIVTLVVFGFAWFPHSWILCFIGACSGPLLLDFVSGTASRQVVEPVTTPFIHINNDGKRILDVSAEGVGCDKPRVKRLRRQPRASASYQEPLGLANVGDQPSCSHTGDCLTNLPADVQRPPAVPTVPAGTYTSDTFMVSPPTSVVNNYEDTTRAVDTGMPQGAAPSCGTTCSLGHENLQPANDQPTTTTASQCAGRTSEQPQQNCSVESSHLGPPTEYRCFGPCTCVCSNCQATFWYEERLSSSTRRTGPLYHRCCHGGKVQLYIPHDYPDNNGHNVLRQDIGEGLIDLLDHHNALVQLFRTARDKLQEADVPEFKVRLFSVIGSAQHELPTADAIGAIVFDSGPETEAEFDIIVEAHSGEPQRISRLYPCYMALHFPLLFVYGEQGYHTDLRLIDTRGMDQDSDKRITMADTQAQASTSIQQAEDRARAKGKQVIVEEEPTDIMNLKPEDLGKPLDLKVYRKWISKNIPDPSPTGICFMLLDKQGGAIQASGQLPDMRQLDTRLQLDGCYRIQGYGCKRTDNWQRTLDNKVTLLFERYTQVAPIQDEGFQKHYFSFAAYNEVCRRADTREPILTDYIGMIRNIGGIREFGDATTNIISRRNIEIQNLNGNTLMLTLWNELATGFPITTLEDMEQPVIIAASSCWAKRHAGTIQLSSTPATAIYINPEVVEADHIEQAYKELMGSAPPLHLQQISRIATEDEPPVQTMTLGMIMEAATQTIMQQHFTTDAVIVKIDESKGWFFNRCRGCGNPIEEHMPHRHCQEPGTQPPANYSYCF